MKTKTNFQKVLALILSLAMMLSVCTMGFSVNAETEATGTDLSYFVINDCVTNEGWVNAEHAVKYGVKLEGRTLARVTPVSGQAANGGAYFWAKNYVGDLTVEEAQTVNTLSYYVNNPTDVTLKYEYIRYANDAKNLAGLGNGYIYLLNTATGEILPQLADRWIRVPAGFKGYVIYDLSKSDNYGYGKETAVDEEGKIVAGAVTDTTQYSVDLIKKNLFQSFAFNVQEISKMLGKCWYYDDVAISTKTVTELADYLSDSPVSFIFNQASARVQGDDGVVFWGGNAENAIFANPQSNGTTYGTIVDYEGFDGKGLQFTTKIAGKLANVATLYINSAIKNSEGTELPFAIENAKGIAFRMKKTGDIGFHITANGEANKVKATYYLVADTGYVTVADSIPNGDFSGTVYAIFNEAAVGLNSNETMVTWSDFVSSRDDFNFGFYASKPSNMHTEGANLTFGSFGFIYDTDSFMAQLNPVVVAGDKLPKRWDYGSTGYNTYYGAFTATTDGDKVTLVCTAPTKAVGAQKGDFIWIKNDNSKFTVNDADKVKALSFYIKVPDLGEGATYNITPQLNSDVIRYYGSLTAINYDGTIAAHCDGVTDCSKRASVEVPSGFEGIIVMDVSTENVVKDNYGNGTAYSFADYVTANGGLAGVALIGYASVVFEIGDTFVYDDLRLVYNDSASYIAEVQSPAVTAARVAEKEANDEAEKDSIIENGIVFNNGNNPNSTVMSNNTANRPIDVTYAENDSDDGYASSLIFHDWKNNGEENTNQQCIYGTVSLPSDIDASKAVAIAYKLDVTNPNSLGYTWTYQINSAQYGIAVDLYLIDDATGAITTATAINRNDEFKGTVVAVLKTVKNSWGEGEWTWEEFVKANGFNKFNFWANLTSTHYSTVSQEVQKEIVDENGNPVLDEEGNPTYETVTEEVEVKNYDGFSANVDEFTLLFEGSKLLNSIEQSYDTNKYFTSTIAADSNAFGGYTNLVNSYSGSEVGTSIYDAVIDRTSNDFPTYKFTRNSNEHTTTSAYTIRMSNKSTLTKEEMIAKEAIVYYVKVSDDGNLPIGFELGAGNGVSTSVMTYNIKTDEYQTLLPGGLKLTDFEGYVIIPLQNAIVKNLSYADYINNVGFGGYYFYMWYTSVTASEFSLGDFRFVDSMSDFFEEIGAVTTDGDANGDGAVDIRDTVRLKKFNSDATTLLAYQNVDIDRNGKFETATELIASRKQNLGVDYTVYEDVEIGMSIFHHNLGSWDDAYSKYGKEEDFINTYMTTNPYELSVIKERGGSAWYYISHVGMFDDDSLELNEAWKNDIAVKAQRLKALDLWEVVAGFFTEEILWSKQINADQFKVVTKYLRETYPDKRIFACLAIGEVNGVKDTETGEYTVAKPTYELYQYVTDIGYDWYTQGYDANVSMFNNMKTNIQTSEVDGSTIERTDIKYWFFPTAYSPVVDGVVSRDDAYMVEQIVDVFDAIFSDTTLVPENQRGGFMFYNWKSFQATETDEEGNETKAYDENGNPIYSALGLDQLVSEYGYTDTAKALVEIASKYVN